MHMSLCDAWSLWMLLFFSSFFVALCVLVFLGVFLLFFLI